MMSLLYKFLLLQKMRGSLFEYILATLNSSLRRRGLDITISLQEEPDTNRESHTDTHDGDEKKDVAELSALL